MPQIFHVEEDISRAKTLDKKFYTDAAYFERAKEKLFANSWQYVGSTGQVPDPGMVQPFVLLEGYINEPLVLTRDKEGGLHLLSNVCTHRGNIVAPVSCTLNHLRCRYHGRLFQLDGRFVSMPEFKEVQNFPTCEDDLRSLPLRQWGKWLFTSLNNSQPAELYLEAMMDRLEWLPVDEFVFQPQWSKDFIVHAHWALYCENYLEGFHIPFVHAGLNAVIDFGNYTTEIYKYSNLQLGIAKSAENCFDLPATSIDYGRNIAAYYFFIFPNMMFNFYPWGLSVNVVNPIGASQSRISFYTFVWKPERFNTGAGAGLDAVELEDEEVVEQVQRGVQSKFYVHGRYSVTREQGTHHFHRIIAELMG